jgi:hypothetical protein
MFDVLLFKRMNIRHRTSNIQCETAAIAPPPAMFVPIGAAAGPRCVPFQQCQVEAMRRQLLSAPLTARRVTAADERLYLRARAAGEGLRGGRRHGF